MTSSSEPPRRSTVSSACSRRAAAARELLSPPVAVRSTSGMVGLRVDVRTTRVLERWRP